MHTEANLEITRNLSGRLEAVRVVMPVWQREIDDRAKKVDMPFLGMRFNVFGNMDFDKTCNDAVKAFCTLCEISGAGLEEELTSLGWKNITDNVFVFQLNDSNSVFIQMVTTGDQVHEFINFSETSIKESELIHAD